MTMTEGATLTALAVPREKIPRKRNKKSSVALGP